MKMINKILLATAGIAGGAAAASVAGGNVLYDSFIKRNEKTRFIPYNKITEDKWLSTHSNDTFIKSEDGLKLHARFVPAIEEKHRYAILCHGYHGNALECGHAARQFFMWGFHVLLPDLRGHGESEGNYVGMGWPERKDLCQWIYRIVNNDPQAQILLMGWSMGAATVMASTEQPLPPNVRVMIEDCGFSSIKDECATQLRELVHLPAFPLIYTGSLVTRLRAGYSLREGDLKKIMAKSSIPKLFIHGSADKFVPFRMVHELYDAAREPKELMVVKGAAHMEASVKEPERYWKTVKEFWTKHFA